jgi:hypothetical protein
MDYNERGLKNTPIVEDGAMAKEENQSAAFRNYHKILPQSECCHGVMVVWWAGFLKNKFCSRDFVPFLLMVRRTYRQTLYLNNTFSHTSHDLPYSSFFISTTAISNILSLRTDNSHTTTWQTSQLEAA